MPSPWHRRDLRILQSVLREPDIRDYDPAAVIASCRDLGANVLVVNGGGIVDFVPCDRPCANPNRFMAPGQDILAELVPLAHAADLRVVARIDFRGVVEAVYRRHPDWFAVEADGSPQTTTYTGVPLHAACFNGVYRSEQAPAFARWLIETYDVDGIWHNAPGVHSVCHCARCRAAYRDATGDELPTASELLDPTLAAYRRLKSDWAEAHVVGIRDAVKGCGDDKAYAVEVFNLVDTRITALQGPDLARTARHADFLTSVCFTSGTYHRHQHASFDTPATTVRFLKAIDPERRAVAVVGHNGSAWRLVREPPIDTALWNWQVVAAGGGLWNCLFNGQHPGATEDRRNAGIVAPCFAFDRATEGRWARARPVAEIGCWYSRATGTWCADRGDLDRFPDTWDGLAGLLGDEHLQWRFVLGDHAGDADLAGLRVLILPDAVCLGDEQAAAIERFVRAGGHLLASRDVGLADLTGQPRAHAALAELIGCTPTAHEVGIRTDCYQHLRHRPAWIEPLAADTELLFAYGHLRLASAADPRAVVLNHVPAIPNQPPEFAWRAAYDDPHPACIQRRHGAGSVTWFASGIEAAIHVTRHPDLTGLYAAALRSGLREPLVGGRVPRALRVHLLRDADDDGRYYLGLVNTAGDGRRPLHESTPLHDVELRLRIPGRRCARLAVHGPEATAPQHTDDDGALILRIPRIERAWFGELIAGS